jgi:hypothetical protein
MRGVELVDVDIHGEIVNLTVNGVDIGPLVNAELDRRYSGRAKMRPADPADFRDAWGILERLWDQTIRPSNELAGCDLSCCTSRLTASGHSSRRCATWCSPQGAAVLTLGFSRGRALIVRPPGGCRFRPKFPPVRDGAWRRCSRVPGLIRRA